MVPQLVPYVSFSTSVFQHYSCFKKPCLGAFSLFLLLEAVQLPTAHQQQPQKDVVPFWATVTLASSTEK